MGQLAGDTDLITISIPILIRISDIMKGIMNIKDILINMVTFLGFGKGGNEDLRRDKQMMLT